jgi:DNA-binding MarR family transcriptional regulator
VGGVGSLLINILAARYIQPSEDVEITWTEEFILKFLEGRGEQSLKDFQKQTKLYKGTIKATLERLIEKQLIERRKVLVGKTGARTETNYKLKARS